MCKNRQIDVCYFDELAETVDRVKHFNNNWSEKRI